MIWSYFVINQIKIYVDTTNNKGVSVHLSFYLSNLKVWCIFVLVAVQNFAFFPINCTTPFKKSNSLLKLSPLDPSLRGMNAIPLCSLRKLIPCEVDTVGVTTFVHGY